MKKIYIVLTYTGTILSRVVKIYTRKKYSHISISLDENLDRMYSFGRLWAYNPFWGGFVQESPDRGTFKRFSNTESKIYSLEVSDWEYKKIKRTIRTIEKDKHNYKFNVIGLSAVMFNIKVNRKKCFYCAEFVKYVLDNAGLDYDLPNIIKPADFECINNLNVVYSGRLADYRT